jgi:hypothetical protein
VIMGEALNRQHYHHRCQISNAVCYRRSSLGTQMRNVRVDDELDQIARDEGHQNQEAICRATT